MLNICEDNSAAECWSKIIFLSDSIHKLFCAAFGRFKAEHVLTVFHLALALLANTRSHVALASSHVDGQALPPCPPGGAMSQRWAEPQRQQVGAAASVLTPHTLPALHPPVYHFPPSVHKGKVSVALLPPRMGLPSEQLGCTQPLQTKS